jgi:hypothetical protein
VTKRQLVGWVLVGLMALSIAVLGVSAGLNIAFNIGIQTGVLAAALAWVVVVAAAAASLLVTFWVLTRISDAADKRLKDPGKSYTQYIGAVVGVFAGLISGVLQEEPILGITLALIVAIISTLAAQFIAKHTGVGIALYFLILVVIGLVVVMTTSAGEFTRWLVDRTARDWMLLAAIVLITLGVPLSVWRIERYRARRHDGSL